MLKYEKEVATKTLIQEIRICSACKEYKLDDSNFGKC